MTIIVILLQVGINVGLIKGLPRKFNLGARIIAYSVGMILPFVLFAIVFLYRPIHYEVTDNDIVIHRPIGDYVIEIKHISKIGKLDHGIASTMRRTMASGGLFGYFGEVKDGRDQLYTFFATRRDRYVLIEMTEGNKYVLSPDDENFVKQLEPSLQKPM